MPKKRRNCVIPMPNVWLFNFCALLGKRLSQGPANIPSQQSCTSLEVEDDACCRWPGSGVVDTGSQRANSYPLPPRCAVDHSITQPESSEISIERGHWFRTSNLCGHDQ